MNTQTRTRTHRHAHSCSSHLFKTDIHENSLSFNFTHTCTSPPHSGAYLIIFLVFVQIIAILNYCYSTPYLPGHTTKYKFVVCSLSLALSNICSSIHWCMHTFKGKHSFIQTLNIYSSSNSNISIETLTKARSNAHFYTRLERHSLEHRLTCKCSHHNWTVTLAELLSISPRYSFSVNT